MRLFVIKVTDYLRVSLQPFVDDRRWIKKRAWTMEGDATRCPLDHVNAAIPYSIWMTQIFGRVDP